MITAIRTMLTCRWSARRIQRYLDADPAAALAPHEQRRLAEHLATCARCTEAADQYRGLQRALLRWSARRAPDPAVAARLQRYTEQVMSRDPG